MNSTLIVKTLQNGETKMDTLLTGTCGVRFLRTSQLLVLAELSVLHVVPAV